MKFNLYYIRLLSICIIVSFIITCFIAVFPTNLDTCNCENSIETHNSIHNDVAKKKLYDSVVKDDLNKPRLAILVPFRDRFDELLKFAPHMNSFLNRQNIPHHIFILNQNDKYRFNRASLINVGFLYTKNEFDYIAMHDVDLLPLNDNLKYEFPKDGPLHIASPDFHPKYHYATFVGGILLIRREHFEQVNGMSNKYWGWGLEDDEFYVRLKDLGLQVHRPTNITTGTENTFAHIHDRLHRKRDTAKCYNQRDVTRRRDHETGLNTIKYKIVERRELTIDEITRITILNINLECDKNSTPWCDCDGKIASDSAAAAASSSKNKKPKKS